MLLTHERIQALIHFLESNFFNRVMKALLFALGLIVLVGVYDRKCLKNFNTEEAMDSAQLGRNIAEGRGYTTSFIRPFSIFLLQRKAQASGGTIAGIGPGATRMNNNHPDLANPPVYPMFLAGLMKTLKFKYEVVTNKTFWSSGGFFRHYQPELLIALANQGLLIIAGFLTFYIARKLFDRAAAWLSMLLVFGSGLLWQFSVSGLSTMLLIDIFLLLVIVLLKFEEGTTQPEGLGPSNLPLVCSAALGLIIGVGMLTRYSFGWLLIPLIIYFCLFGGTRRIMYVFVAGCAFALVVMPWILRNWHVSGTCFGIPGYAVAEGTIFFQGTQLENSTHPSLNGLFRVAPYLLKFRANLHQIMNGEIMSFTSNWSLMLFFCGLMLGFRSQTAKRLRYFVMGCLVTFVFVEALGRTHLSDDVPVLNSENLLVILAPLTFMYGAVFFLIFTDQIKVPMEALRYVIRAGVIVLSALTFLSHGWSPTANVLAYPPYHPPDIQRVASIMGKDDLIMSDIPWAVAWYGRHECVSLALNPKDEFAQFDYIKPVNALYITSKSAKIDLMNDYDPKEADSWTHFVVDAVVKNSVPVKFPLGHVVYLSSGLLLTDRPM